MAPLHLVIHAASPADAARIMRALRTGDPDCVPEIATGAASPAGPDKVATVRAVAAASAEPAIDPALRHELNNHLALIRMLADLLVERGALTPADCAKVREIGSSADAAAQVIRRPKQPA
jgi:hypothetical protein